MKIIADLHIHSHYARACSKDLTPANLAVWAKKKGINILGTGDCLHPGWLKELKDTLVESQYEGLYLVAKDSTSPPTSPQAWEGEVMFLLTTEVSSIYKQDDKVRRVHNLIFFPNFTAVDRVIVALENRGVNLKADGRPIMGLHCDELLKICKDVEGGIEIIPAHAWTPHFGIFGSLSGFDSIEEAFGDQAKHIFAIETGLSSDPKMNWQVSGLDNIALISNSDAHSLRKLGREVNVFEIDSEKLSYSEIIRTIKNKNPQEFLSTIEFFPEEGKYHLDGHSDCKYSALPEQTKKLHGICPVCGKKLLQGVLHRVTDLADRPHGFKPKLAVPYVSAIPLEEIIAETLEVGVGSKKVVTEYQRLVGQKPEFEILLNLPEDQLAKIAGLHLAQSILRVRAGQVYIEAGYDGVFGKVHIYNETERKKIFKKLKQNQLF